MTDDREPFREPRCGCPPESYRLDCEIHWEIVAAALVREIERMPTGTTTRKAVPRDAE